MRLKTETLVDANGMAVVFKYIQNRTARDTTPLTTGSVYCRKDDRSYCYAIGGNDGHEGP